MDYVRDLIGKAKQSAPEDFAEELGGVFALLHFRTVTAEAGHWSYMTTVAKQSPTEVHDFSPSLYLPRIEESELYVIKKARKTFFARTVLVGRAESNDICVDDPSLSKLHVRIQLTRPQLTLCDAGSSNGTWVNGKQLEPEVGVPVAHGDRIVLGTCRFQLFELHRLHDVLRKSIAL